MLHRALLIVFLASLPGVGAAETPEEPRPDARPCRPAGPDERFNADFRDAPLADLARLVSCAAQLNLLFQPPALSDRRFTTIAPKPITLRDLVHLFTTVVHNAGLELDKRGGFTVIRAPAAPSRTTPRRPERPVRPSR